MTPMTRPITYFLVTMAVVACGCSRNMVLGNKPDAQDNNQDASRDGMLEGTGGAGSGGSTATGGRGGGSGGGGGMAGAGGGIPASGGRGTGGGGSSGTGGRATGGGGSSGTGGRATGGSSGSGGKTDGGAGCSADAPFWCASGRITSSGGVSCGDALTQPVCSAGGQWTCPMDWIPLSDCDCAGLQPTNCMCTPSGLSCPDGGSDAVADAGVCDFGCYPNPSGTFCGTGKVVWECWGQSPNVSVLVNGGCTDALTDAVRYCCPSTFLSQCPPRT